MHADCPMGSINTCCVLAVRSPILDLILKRMLFLQEIPGHFGVGNCAKGLQLCWGGVACRKRPSNADSIYHKWHASDV